MLLIARTYLFVTWAVKAAIIATIVIMILRFIVIQVDLNPFGWISLTTRRLTDPILAPIRRGLAGFGVNPKYAPLVAILITILIGFFVLQLVSSVANTITGVLFSLQNQEVVAVFGYILYGLIDLYMALILIRIIFSWAMVSYSNRVMRVLVNTTEPLLGPLRRLIPPVLMFDISPVVAFLILMLFKAAIAGTLLSNARLNFVS
ncbi:MAG TPA: YggT family protein [Pyrinomonadaceae bacterium]|nr:YggT family protein [Pyrinomonadaceae bacterium]